MSKSVKVEGKVFGAAEEAYSTQGYICLADVLFGARFLEPIHVQDWKNGKISCLEEAIYIGPEKFRATVRSFLDWVNQKGLFRREVDLKVETCRKSRSLRYSYHDDEEVETVFRTYYFSPNLTSQKLEQLVQKLEQPPEIAAFIIGKPSSCSECKHEIPKGGFLVMEGRDPLCLACAGLGNLVFLPRGDATLSRRAKKNSSRSVVVLQYSRARKRYERQGILVEEKALT